MPQFRPVLRKECFDFSQLLSFCAIMLSMELYETTLEKEDNMTREALKQEVERFLEAYSLCPEGKAAAQAYLEAFGTEHEQEKAKALIQEIKEDIISIDGLIAFAESEAGKAVFGEEGAKNTAAAAKEAKAKGEDTCICPACQSGKILLANEREFIG